MNVLCKLGRLESWSASVIQRDSERRALVPRVAVKAGACNVQGCRASNQDRFLMDMELQLFLVADGMGGLERGEHASEVLVQSALERGSHDNITAVVTSFSEYANTEE